MTASPEALQQAVTAFRSFPDVVHQMNSTVAQNKQLKEQSLSARKALADTTKQFKRSVKVAESAASNLASSDTSNPAVTTTCTAMEALSKECRLTVKSYQEEIDALTRRCKAAEQGYAAVCQALTDLPADPAAILAACGQQQQDSQAQLTQILSTVDSINQELGNAEKKNNEYRQQIEDLKANGGSSGASGGGSGGSSGGSGGGAFSNDEREELISLRKEVAEYEVEFRSLKNQDITIRKLEDKIFELQTDGAKSIESSIANAKEELALTEGRRANEALEREAMMEAKVQTLELQLKSERAGKEATQNSMLEVDDVVSRKEAAWEAQRQILVDDNTRVREELQSVKRERDETAMKLSALDSRSAPSSGNGLSVQELMLERNAYEAEVSELSATNSLLRDEVRKKEEEIVVDKREYQAKIDALMREKSSLNTNLASLESQLSGAPSQSYVDNMKRELRILKRLEYNADDVDTDHDPEIAGGNHDDEKDLEAVLVGKLRKAEKELIAERNSKTELMKTTDTLKKELAKSELARRESVKLVASLEKDLETAIATPAEGTNTRRESSKKHLMRPQEQPEALEHILDPSTPPPPIGSPVQKTAAATEYAEDDHSVATIVMAQRDRLRARCEALEAERDSFKRELQVQVQASENLKSDNTKLYEKVRYLQNYNKGNTNKAYQRSHVGADRDLDLEALEQRYEASVDPFKQFSKAERQRKLGEMTPVERTVFMVAKTVLSTKEMRTGLFFYVVAMHLLVFVTTYHWSHMAGCGDVYHDKEHLSHLPPSLPDHIQQAMIAKDATHNSVGG